jgi:deoxyribonuclease-1-like protein
LVARARTKKEQSLRKFFAPLVSLVMTISTGAGVGGWAYRDTGPVRAVIERVQPWITSLRGLIAQREAEGPSAVRNQIAQRLAEGTSPVAQVAQRLAGSQQQPTPQQPVAEAGNTVTICSFNIQVFGTSKMGKPDVMRVIVDVIRRFDIVAIQEVRSKDDTIVPRLVQMINADGHQYQFVIGPRLGRTVSTEQYTFIYNTRRVEVDPRSVLTMADASDALHREPLLARFRVRGVDPASAFSFWLMDMHTDPDEVPQEMDALAGAFTSVQQQGWGEDDVILLGDLNTDSAHLGRVGQLPGIRCTVVGAPTNTRGNRSYDNIIFDARATVEFTGQSGVLNLMQQYGLSMEQALKISDHMPIWAVFSAYEGGRTGQLARQPGAAAVR